MRSCLQWGMQGGSTPAGPCRRRTPAGTVNSRCATCLRASKLVIFATAPNHGARALFGLWVKGSPHTAGAAEA